jgi:hypothetical protein
MIFAKHLQSNGRERAFTIERGGGAGGWIAREGDGRAPFRTSHIRDWRKVEAAIALFERKASVLRQEGWTEI